MDLASEFWLADPEQVAARLDALAAGAAVPARTLRFGTSYRGRDLVAFEAGSGPLRLAVVAGLHAAELGSGFGMLAFAHTLATGRGPDGEDLSEWVSATLAAQTITFVPVLNIDGAARMARFLPGCYTRNRFSTADWDAYTEFVRAPLAAFGLTRGKDLFLTDEQLRIWTQERGGMLGQLWSDQGVDLWEDWRNFRAPETRALRDLLDRIQPHAIFEMHCHESPTAMYVPIPAARGADRRTQLEYGEAMMTALLEAGVPCSRHSVRTYHYPDDLHQFPDVAYERYGGLVLFGEVCFGLTLDQQRERMRATPLGRRDAGLREPSQEEILRGVWIWLKTLVDLGGQRSYR